ncbi:MAG: GNAT family N-acetyltransferase [Chloroflexota bacterium]
MSLQEHRSLIRHLLDDENPADAMAVYYAYHHPDSRTQLLPFVAQEAERAVGYVALSRTGIDLFRPLMTLRLPYWDMEASVEVIYGAMRSGTAVIISTPSHYLPLINAVFEVQSEQHLRVLYLDPSRFEPVINVLVSQDSAANGLPRFLVHTNSSSGERELAASASLNWQSPRYAEIAVNTQSGQRRRGFGRSVVAAMVQHLLTNGRLPLYAVAEDNEASYQLATSLGFVDRGIRETLLYASLRPRPPL